MSRLLILTPGKLIEMCVMTSQPLLKPGVKYGDGDRPRFAADAF